MATADKRVIQHPFIFLFEYKGVNTQMELFTLFGKIAIENGDANRAIDSTVDKAKSLGSAIGSGLGKAGNVVGTVLSKVGDVAIFLGKATAAGVAAGAAGVAALTNAAVQGYADYEQLVGGVETLFKDSAGVVQGYADNAYKTSGLSANQYMETVTSFSASLLQSLKGDTAAAADYAEMAVTDMSDNANKMGSDMTSIQNAYQGFAKQNYTMLDNLKLGYGGTQTEMKRLINDAAKLDKSVKKNDMSFGNIVKAIHAVQEEMGITGTTAEEADKTISGSVASMKAAWSNLVVEMAKDNGNIETSVKNFTDSVSTAAGNILPRIQTALSGVGEMIVALTPVVTTGLTTLIEELAPVIPEVLQTLLPALITGAATLLSSLVESMPQLISVLVECAPMVIDAFGQLVGAVGQALPGVWAALKPGISEGIAEALSAIGIEVEAADVESTIDDLVKGVKGTIDTLGTELSRITGTIRNKFEKIATTLKENGVTIEGVFKGLKDSFELLAEPIEAAAGAIGEALNLLADWATTDGSYLNTALENIATSFATLASMATHYFRAIEKGLQGDFKGAIEEVGQMYQVWFDGMKEGFGNTADYANEKMGEIGDAINDQSLSIRNVDTSGMETDLNEALIFALEIAGQIKIALNSLGTAASAGVGFTEDSADLVGGVTWDTRWNADGAVLKKPTIFGRVGNTLLGGGEAGAEAVAPIDVLQGYVAEAVAGQNAGLLAALDRIYSATVALNENMAGHVRNGMDGVSFGVNKREFGRLVKDVT